MPAVAAPAAAPSPGACRFAADTFSISRPKSAAASSVIRVLLPIFIRRGASPRFCMLINRCPG